MSFPLTLLSLLINVTFLFDASNFARLLTSSLKTWLHLTGLFFHRYYYYLYWIFAVILPVGLPIALWGESFKWSFVSFVVRYLTTLHSTWFVNSTPHMFGDKPYNGNIAPVENPWVSVTTFGEGYHNYHHTFPWDYSAAELNYGFNLNRKLIDFTAWLGLAWNLKRPSFDLVDSAKTRIRSQYQREEMHDINGRGY